MLCSPLLLFRFSFLTMPAFAATLNVGDKPIVVAEGADVRIGGVGAGVGERHRHRGLRTVSLTNFFANRIFECLKCGN